MGRVDVTGTRRPLRSPMPDQHLDVGALREMHGLRDAKVALAVRRVLEELAPGREVAPRRVDVRARLDDEGAQRSVVGGHPAMGHGPWDEDVVALTNRQNAQPRFERRRAGLDVAELVTDRVPVQRRHLTRDGVADADVGVAEHGPPAGDGVEGLPVLARDQVVQAQVPGEQGVVGVQGPVGQLPRLGGDERRWHVAVVEQGRLRGEPLLAHQLLEEEAARFVAVLDVPLRRDVADSAVMRHAGDLAI